MYSHFDSERENLNWNDWTTLYHYAEALVKWCPNIIAEDSQAMVNYLTDTTYICVWLNVDGELMWLTGTYAELSTFMDEWLSDYYDGGDK